MKKLIVSVCLLVAVLSCCSIGALAYNYGIVEDHNINFMENYWGQRNDAFFMYYQAATRKVDTYASTELSTTTDATGYADTHIWALDGQYQYQISNQYNDGFYKCPGAFIGKKYAKKTIHYAQRQIPNHTLDVWETRRFAN